MRIYKVKKPKNKSKKLGHKPVQRKKKAKKEARKGKKGVIKTKVSQAKGAGSRKASSPALKI